MAAQAQDMTVYPVRSASRESREAMMQVAIGATGAVGAIVKNDQQLGITFVSTGNYTITYPACQNVFITAQILAVDATPTATTMVTLAESPTAGTATIQFLLTATAANIESGSTLKLFFRLNAGDALS